MQRTKLSLMIAALLAAPCAHADDAELRARIEKLEAMVQTLSAQLKQVDSKTEAIASQQEAVASTSAPVASGGGGEAGAAPGTTTIYGYGELNYNHFRDASRSQADLRRAVFGFGHRFDADTRFMSEFEFEHAVASSGDAGEAEVEQFYIDTRLAPSANLKAGLFLMPFGLLNESHEPTAYYGVERNFVETAIIPSTWREGGVGLYGSSDAGLAWDAGITTGFNLAKWDPASTSACRQSPLGCVHQEMQLANAKDLALYGALNWRGTPGLVVGASLFSGGAGQGGLVGSSNPSAAAQPTLDGARVTLWDVHARWTPDRWDLSAVYAHGAISGTVAYNQAPPQAGEATPHPQRVLRLVHPGGLPPMGQRQALAGALRPVRTLQCRQFLRRPAHRRCPGRHAGRHRIGGHRRPQLQAQSQCRSQSRLPVLPCRFLAQPLRSRPGFHVLAWVSPCSASPAAPWPTRNT